MTNYEFHDVCELFPDMDAEQFDTFVAGGQVHDISPALWEAITKIVIARQ